MSNEQFGGRTVHASDLYSLGATLIYLVTGRHTAEFSQENLRIQFESSVNLRSDLIDWLKWMTQLFYAIHPFIILNKSIVVNLAFVVWLTGTLPFTIKGMSFLIEAWGFIIRATRLHFNYQEIILTYEWLGLKFYKFPIRKNTISQLCYTNRYEKITIIAAQKQYVLSAYYEGLVEPEMEWLAHEISEWSGVPITIEDEGQEQEVERMAKTVDS